jgi:hypothetical protein
LLTGALTWQGRQAPFAVDKIVAEPVADLDEILDAAERRAPAYEFVVLRRDAHEPDRPPVGTQDGEELFSLADRAAEIFLRVLDKQRCGAGRDIRDGRRLAVELRLVPRVRTNEHLRIDPGEVSGQHERCHVAHRPCGERRSKAAIVSNDPIRQVAAIRAPGDAEVRAACDALGDERVHADEDVPRRTVAPIAEVRIRETLAIPCRAAWIAVEDAHPGSRQDLELEHRRPAVLRLRAAMDLNDERAGPAKARRLGSLDEPALDPPPVDLVRALDRLEEPDVVEHQVVQTAQPARRITVRLGPDVRQLGRRRADEGEARAAIDFDLIEARDVFPALGQPFEPAVVRGDPPQLVRAVARGAER